MKKIPKDEPNEIIKIRLDLEDNDSLYNKFLELKKKIGINANTEVMRYALKKAYDSLFKGDNK